MSNTDNDRKKCANKAWILKKNIPLTNETRSLHHSLTQTLDEHGFMWLQSRLARFLPDKALKYKILALVLKLFVNLLTDFSQKFLARSSHKLTLSKSWQSWKFTLSLFHNFRNRKKLSLSFLSWLTSSYSHEISSVPKQNT